MTSARVGCPGSPLARSQKQKNKMNDENINIKGLKLNDRAIDVLKEMQIQNNGPVAMYVRTISEVVDLLLLDEEADPLQNLEHARALTMLKMDLQIINDVGDEPDEV